MKQKLRYNGKDGKPYILMVPARDLTSDDVAAIGEQWGVSPDKVVALLTDGAPGRRVASGRPLYELVGRGKQRSDPQLDSKESKESKQ